MNTWKIQKNGKNIEELRIQKLTDNHTINLLNNEIQNKNNEIAELKKVYENTQNKIDFIYQSKSWKARAIVDELTAKYPLKK